MTLKGGKKPPQRIRNKRNFQNLTKNTYGKVLSNIKLNSERLNVLPLGEEHGKDLLLPLPFTRC